MAATVGTVKTFLGLDPASTVDATAMTQAVDAANSIIEAEWAPDLDPLAWPAHVDFAATMQAARWYGRRGSVGGIAAFADVGVAYIPKLDPDVKAMLGLGEYQPPVIA